MANSKLYLEAISGRPVDSIAYPYGDCNADTLAVAKELHLNAAFTTREKVVTSRTDPYQIGRFQVRNINGAEFARSIVKWQQSAQFL
jgi:peptidoglycan/xylan/chitin deacetylase (PgdA/CDA1 family)